MDETVQKLEKKIKKNVSSRVHISSRVRIQIFKQRQKKKSAYSSVADFLYFPACLQISLETLTTTFAELCKWNSVRRHKLLQLVQSKIADGSSMDVFALLNSFLVFFSPSLHFNNLYLIFFFSFHWRQHHFSEFSMEDKSNTPFSRNVHRAYSRNPRLTKEADTHGLWLGLIKAGSVNHPW